MATTFQNHYHNFEPHFQKTFPPGPDIPPTMKTAMKTGVENWGQIKN
jgi:hypothetical protein